MEMHLSGMVCNGTWTETGHCPGQRHLFPQAGTSADNVAQAGTILVPSDEGEMTAYIRDLRRLRELNPRLLFPGHGPVVTNPREITDPLHPALERNGMKRCSKPGKVD